MKQIIPIMLMFTALATVGCQSGQVAGRHYDVLLISDPPGATPYILRADELNAERQRRHNRGMAADDAAIMRDDAFLSQHKVSSGVLMGSDNEPGKVRYPGHRHVLIAVLPNREPVMSDVFTPPATLRVWLHNNDEALDGE